MRVRSPLLFLLAFLFASVPWTSVLAQTAEEDEDIAMGEEMMYLGEEILVITASKYEQKITDVPASVSVITAKDIQTSAAATTADLLRSVPGLNVVQLGARDVNIAGRSGVGTLSNSQLVLVDGRSVYQDFYGFVAWDLVPADTDEIAQVEVVRGPGSAVHGANAMSGVVNIRTKAPRESQGLKVKLGAGELNTQNAALTFASAADKLAYKIHASYYAQDAYERPKTTPSGTPLFAFEDEGTEQPKFTLRLDYDMDRDSKLWFDTGWAQTSGLIHTGIGPFQMDGVNMYHFKAQWEGANLSARFFLNWLDGDAQNLLQPLIQTFDQKTYDLELTGNYLLGGSHLVSFGANARYNDFDLSLAPLESSRTDLGLFAQDEWMLGDKFAWTLGFRVDNFSNFGTAVSPRTNLRFKLTDNHTLRASYSQAYRSPSLIENYLETTIYTPVPMPFNPNFILVTRAVGNPDLDREKIQAVEVGYAGVWGRYVDVSLAVYQNESTDFVDFYPNQFYSDSDPPPGWPFPPGFGTVPPGRLPKTYSYRNIGTSEDQGVEFGLGFTLPAGFSARANYTYQKESDVTEDKYDPTTNPLGYLPNLAPENKYFVEVGFNNARKDGFFGALSYQHSDEAFFADVLNEPYWGSTEAYDTINASAGWKFAQDKYRVTVKGTNLSDEQVQQHIFGDIIGRRVFAEVRLLFGK